MQDASQGGDDLDPVGEDEEEDQGTPAADSDADSRPTTPAIGRSSAPRKKRGGRWARRGSRRTVQNDLEGRDTGSDMGTPKKRGGWRGGRGAGGGRWGKPRGGPSHVTQVPLDKAGNMANVKDDEVELPGDPEGEQKVDKNGNLKGDREYRVRTFLIEGKGERLYMLSTEPARCIGFRDSYLFFQKHPQLFKIILEEDAKKDLIDRSLIPHSYKGRAIGVVTARSVFREFGAKIIIGGKRIIDDYQVAAGRAEGAVEGEFAVPEDNVPATGDEYDRNRFVAWHGASAVYHTGAPSVPAVNGKAVEGKKRKFVVTGSNWMLEHAREARYDWYQFSINSHADSDSRFNSSLAASRRHNLNGVYDVHTNVMQYPKIMQPTHAKLEQVPPEAPMLKYPTATNGEANSEQVNGTGPSANEQDLTTDTIFPELPASYTRNFMVTDTYYKGPATSTFGYPGPEGSVVDVGPPGLTQIPEHVLAELPEECRQAFFEAREEERKWKSSWGTEDDDKARAKVHISYNV